MLTTIKTNLTSGFYIHNRKNIMHFDLAEGDAKSIFNRTTLLSLNSQNKRNPIETYTKKIRIKGLGLRANLENNSLVLNLGYSQKTIVAIPSFISKVKLGKTGIILESSDIELLGSFAKELCSFKPTSVYKLKGLVLRGHVFKKKTPKKR